MTQDAAKRAARKAIELWQSDAWKRRSEDEADDDLIDKVAEAIDAAVAEARREEIARCPNHAD